MGRKLDYFLTEATDLAMDIVRRINHQGGNVSAVMLDSWRGPRLVYDSDRSRTCENNCQFCPHRKVLAEVNEEGDPNELTGTLYRFTKPIDVRLYGPETYLSCKATERLVQCYCACILCDERLLDPVLLRGELELIRDFRIVWMRGKTRAQMDKEEEALKLKIIETVYFAADCPRRTMIKKFCTELGWDPRQSKFVKK